MLAKNHTYATIGADGWQRGEPPRDGNVYELAIEMPDGKYRAIGLHRFEIRGRVRRWYREEWWGKRRRNDSDELMVQPRAWRSLEAWACSQHGLDDEIPF